MKKLLKAIPIPFAGVMLGLAALGNLLQSYSEGVRLFFGALAAIIWVLLVLKVIFCWPGVKAAMDDPVVASVSGTFPMATMLLSVYAKPFVGPTAQFIWYLGIALHVALILWFTVKFMLKPVMPKVFASYFIVYVGIVVASLTAPAYEMTATVGTWCFWFGFICLLGLLAFVGYRYVKFPVKMAPPQPLVCIFAAPAALCLAGYIQSVAPKSIGMIYFMLVLSQALYVMVLLKLPKLLKLPFFPSYAAFTFPFVITAISAKQSMACLAKLNAPAPWLSTVVLVETIIAAVLVVYALVRYIMALNKSVKAPA